MKRSKFTDEQILAIVKEGEAGRKVADVCRTHVRAERGREIKVATRHHRDALARASVG